MERLSMRWEDEPVDSYEEAVVKMLKYMEAEVDGHGWDQAPILGVVNASTLLESTVALEVEVPRLPEEFFEDYQKSFSDLAMSTFLAETLNATEYQEFLNEGVRKGFQGWLLCGEFYSTELDENGIPNAGPNEARMVIFVDLDTVARGVIRTRGEAESKVLDRFPPVIVRNLALLVAGGIMSIVRRSLDSEEDN